MRPGSPIDGLLVLDKPPGWTSHDVVARVRRLIGERRTGHAGTLDPLATGVLVLGVGQGTRVLQYLSAAGKAYAARLRLGVTTDTYDADGEVTATAAVGGLSQARIEAALSRFRGTFQQLPPLFSAIKRNGRPLYEYARAGLEVEVAARTVRIDDIRIRAYEAPDLELEVSCASGFYVRSLAHDLGQALGCGAHLRALVRTRAGPFCLADTVTLEALAEKVAAGSLRDLLWSLDAPLRQWMAVILADGHVTDLVNGKAVQLPAHVELPHPSLCRAYSTAGELIAVLTLDEDRRAKPIKVFPAGRRGLNLQLDEFRSSRTTWCDG